ncbi:ATP-binding protein [Pseudoalteromonas denitrificans]|uniref:histidine kinase n=1 Tax=Pseudoalteromonas denitrificans DSM 6059 TaxID=1123010 RepID=A0A1I1FIJ6_9GAMM|nr:ATP-binding protein [Pseudoalteromonas denitrificans]SFB96943.1 two-component system, OmpR family, sensor histidine kinase QseC [Pseudoalteromonas denitrificans DSM 6059]
MSIRNYLVLILLSSIILVCFSAAISGYKASMSQADQMFDEQLKSISRAMISVEGKLKTHTKSEASNFAVQLWTNKELTLNLIPNPNLKSALGKFVEGFSYVNFANQRWRLYANNDADLERWIFVAQPVKYRFQLAENMTLAAVTPLILSMPFLALLISFTIKRSLKPLVSLSRQLQKKQADDFSPLIIEHNSNELSPVIEKLNKLFNRVENAFLREKHFASDAAHELRTPLSGLNIAIHNLTVNLGQTKELNAIQKGIERMSHVVEQILMLNRTHPDHIVQTFEVINLQKAVQSVVMDLYPQVELREQDISLEGSEAPILGEHFTLKTLLQNLIGNAIKYTPKKGQVKIKINQKADKINLLIEDSGPGICEADYERVFDRFYRSGGDQHKSSVIGCGLGLAIVKHIIDIYQGEILLGSSPLGGLSVKITFTAYDNNLGK